jgi:DMSO/TMAO reductase YedYZ molybdopterin-dependent catalytic subunit
MANDDGILGQIKQKLVDSKKKWSQEGRLLTGNSADPATRLPPGQREVKNWPVLDLGIQPDVTAANWRLEVGGLVDFPLVWNWQKFIGHAQEEFLSDIHCVTAWSRYDNRWKGMSTRALLDLVKPRKEAKFVVQHGLDGYTTNVPLEYFADDDVLLAHEWEGQPISREHGGPVRLVLPKLYFWKSAKWISKLEFVAEDKAGFWEVRGYHMRGDPWTEERYG